MRGPACRHAMQDMLSVLMAARLPPEGASMSEQRRANKRTRRRSTHKVQEEQQHFRAFLATHTRPTLTIVRTELVSQAVLKVIERSGNAHKIETVDISHRSHMPYPLHTVAPPVLVNQSGIVQGSELFRLLSKPSTH